MGQNYEFSVQSPTPIGCKSKIDYERLRISLFCFKYYPAKVYRCDKPGKWLRISGDSLLVDHKKARDPVFKAHYVTVLNQKLLN